MLGDCRWDKIYLNVIEIVNLLSVLMTIRQYERGMKSSILAGQFSSMFNSSDNLYGYIF